MKENRYDLTQGSILTKLLHVALPVMGTQFMQMTYNLTDMFWLGRMGAGAVAASGTVGMYLWLGMAFLLLGRMGAEIGVSQNMGRREPETARRYAHTSIALALLVGVLYAAFMMLFRSPLIGFLNIREAQVVANAEIYLLLVAPGVPLAFVSAAVNGSFSGSGNTRVPFYINAVGLGVNMILDPLLIFTAGLGIAGAAIATVIAQAVVCVLLLAALRRLKRRPFPDFKLLVRPDTSLLPQILKWGGPAAVESLLFTLLSMIIQRLVAGYGSDAIAVARVGSQVESLSWLIAGGYGAAVTSFVGQNFGAGKWTRIHKGFKLSLAAMSVWGVLVTSLLFFGGRAIFSVFLNDPAILSMGQTYLKILAVCQLAGCLEFTTAGSFRGMGRTLPPSIASICANALRVGLAYIFMARWGLNGIWWSISVGAVIRGLWIILWYLAGHARLPRADDPVRPAGQNAQG